jgi:hypothetical protein
MRKVELRSRPLLATGPDDRCSEGIECLGIYRYRNGHQIRAWRAFAERFEYARRAFILAVIR